MEKHEKSMELPCGKCECKGHLSIRCPYVFECVYCTSVRHKSRDCVRVTCFRCREMGHSAKECTGRERKTCCWCKGSGHLSDSCISRGSPISLEESKKINCLNCRGSSHANCIASEKPRRKKKKERKERKERKKHKKVKVNKLPLG